MARLSARLAFGHRTWVRQSMVWCHVISTSKWLSIDPVAPLLAIKLGSAIVVGQAWIIGKLTKWLVFVQSARCWPSDVGLAVDGTLQCHEQL